MPNTPILASEQESLKFFGIKMMPPERYAPMGKEAVFGIGQRRYTLESRYLTSAFIYALWGMSHCITSRDFVCQSPNQNPPQEADLLFEGLPPPIPPKK